jgi:hypothetical protein
MLAPRRAPLHQNIYCSGAVVKLESQTGIEEAHRLATS